MKRKTVHSRFAKSVENPAGRFLVSCAVLLFALSWPIGAYQRVAGPVYLYHLALLPLTLAALRDWQRNKRMGVPFELWWPCAMVMAIAILLALIRKDASPPATAGAGLVFIVTFHSVRNRLLILQALHLFALSVGIMLILSLAVKWNLLYPTAFSLDTEWAMAGPFSISNGLFLVTLAILLLPALLRTAQKDECGLKRTMIWTCLFSAISIALFVIEYKNSNGFYHAAGSNLFLFPTVLITLILLWGMARIAAKLQVARSYLPPGIYQPLLGAVVLGTGAALIQRPSADVGYGFLLALAAAYAHPGHFADAKPVLPWYAIPPVIALLGFNLVFILPGDVRDYERTAQQRLAQKDNAYVRHYMNAVAHFSPNESRTDYYIAKSYLEEGRLNAAADAFARALRPVKPFVLPPPDDRLIEEFLNDMRDISSALPESVRGIAYERSLIAAGREKHALSLLELRTIPSLPAIGCTRPFAQSAALALNDADLTEVFETWDAPLLAGILKSAGPRNSIRGVPESFPQAWLPLVAMARETSETLDLLLFTPAGGFGGSCRVRKAPLSVPDLLAESGWRHWRQTDESVWQLSFAGKGLVELGNGPKIHFHPAPLISSPNNDATWEIVVYLPGVGSNE